PGRPSHRKRQHRLSPDAPISHSPQALRPPTVSPTKKGKTTKAKQFSPGTSKLMRFMLQHPTHLVQSPDRIRLQSREQRSPSRKPRLTLNRIKHSTSAGWEEVGNADTTKTYKVFEEWRNDYHPHQYDMAPTVKLRHFGHPLDRPKDI
ncbi:hypothetical protein B0H13DRAFT_1479082, partial [Mycena leptocephala]